MLAAGADPHAATKDSVSAYRFALQTGLPEVAELLQHAGASEPLSLQDLFVAACARGDQEEASRILSAHPDIFGTLSGAQLRQLPNLTESAQRRRSAPHGRARLADRRPGGDWDASALNLAVFQGNSDLARFLVEHGASWTERQGFGGNVNNTLAWASRNHDPEEGDWVGCADALVTHGMPILKLEGDYSEEVADFLAEERAKAELSKPRVNPGIHEP